MERAREAITEDRWASFRDLLPNAFHQAYKYQRELESWSKEVAFAPKVLNYFLISILFL